VVLDRAEDGDAVTNGAGPAGDDEAVGVLDTPGAGGGFGAGDDVVGAGVGAGEDVAAERTTMVPLKLDWRAGELAATR